jgi:hypothetical protein
MGYDEAEGAPSAEEVAARRKEILDQLEAGELDAKEAAALLSALGSERRRS